MAMIASGPLRLLNSLSAMSSRAARATAVGFLTVSVGACTTVDNPGPAPAPGGILTGKLIVEWLGENNFVYWPDAKNPLTFVTSDGRRIVPQLMYTDGGSIPSILQPIDGFSPWGYAPAYIVHDWLFEQHHCKLPGHEAITFGDSARILGEVIDATMRLGLAPYRPDARALIEAGVRTPTARNLWDRGECRPPPASVRRSTAQGATVFQIDLSRQR